LKRQPTFKAADLFCGAGGTSEALRQICAANKQNLDLVAVNHWPIAIDSHSANHPYAKHMCAKLEAVDPHQLVPRGRLNLLIAGIECTHHSNARGGRPRNDQSRSSAWLILKWCSELYIETIVIENVKEFISWGPLGYDCQPIKSKKGSLFLQFIEALRKLSYNVEYRRLVAADYGDPTTRERLFIIAKRGRNKEIVWPEPTHVPAKVLKHNGNGLFSKRSLQPWKTARKDVIDWTIQSRSIFGRPKPLAKKTIERIAAGFRKQGPAAEPFLVMLYGTNKTRSIDRPLATVTANGNHIGLCEPFLTHYRGKSVMRGIDEPIPTLTTRDSLGLIEPFLINIDHQGGNGDQVRSCDQPVPTVTSKQRTALVEPFMVCPGGPEMATQSVDKPLHTVLTRNSTALVEPFLIAVNHGDKGSASPSARAKSIDQPMPTVTTNRSHGLVEPFIVKYNRTGKAYSVDEPLQTVTAQDRFALVTTESGTYALDIRFRMLTNRELARAQGLTDSYIFTGRTKDITRQIGNMVPIGLAKAVIGAQISI